MSNYLKPLLLPVLLLTSITALASIKTDTVRKSDTVVKKDTVYIFNPSRFSEYEPNYFTSNFGQNYYGQVKFKVSFKFDLDFGNKRDKLFFAYTQLAYWDLYKDSAPIRELDFTPTLYYERRFKSINPAIGKSWHYSLFDVKGGFLHQSDGQPAGIYNRSIFKITANTDMEFARNTPTQDCLGLDVLDITIRTWIWRMVSPDNYNIADYQGYGQLITTWKFDYNRKSASTNSSNSTLNRSYPIVINDVVTPAKAGISNELNISINPFIKVPHWGGFPYILLQYFHGYGENLINYDNRYTGGKALNEFRAGIQFRVF